MENYKLFLFVFFGAGGNLGPGANAPFASYIIRHCSECGMYYLKHEHAEVLYQI
jgi:hypothetical protein